MFRRTFPAILVVALSLPCAAALAQETTGTIVGTVTDDSGAVVPGVTVSARNLATGRTAETVSTGTGRYTLPLLAIGPYELTFQLSGFQPVTVRGIDLHVNDRLEVNGKLAVGGVAETVEVTAAQQFVQPTAQLQSLVQPKQVMELPLNNRNFVQLATLAPGVSSDLPDEVGVGLTSTVSISVNGARRNSVNWLVDGVSNVDVGSNITLLSTPTLESIQEFRIITSSYAAEWPRSGGGIVNVVTKSGTNRFLGSVYEFYRDDKLNANSWFRNQSTNPDVQKPAALDYNNFGYTLGGPILPWRDKAFFFWSQEWRRITRAPASVSTGVPDPSWLNDPANPNYVAPELRDPNAVRLLAAWPAPNLTTTGANNYILAVPNVNNTRQEVIRLDYDPTASWRLTGRYTHDLSETEEARGLFTPGPAIPNIATTETKVPGQVLALQMRTIVTSSAVNEVALHRSSNVIKSTNPEGTRNRRADYGLEIPELFAENTNSLIPFVSVSGLSSLGSNQLYNIEYTNWTVTDNFTYQRGSHSMKAGALLTWEQKNENAASVSQGNFAFVAGGGRTAFQNFLTGNRDGLCTACTYTEAERDITMNLRFNRWEFYAQDSWRPRPNLTLDFGLRYSLYPPITDENDLLVTFDPSAYNAAQAPAFANPTGTLIDRGTGDLLVGIIQAGRNSPFGRAIYEYQKDSIQPRLGFSWDPSATGDTIVRGGYGIYFDQPLVGIFEQNSFTTPPIVNNVTIQGAALSNPTAGTTPTTSGVRTIQATSTDFKNPRTMQWNVGMTRRLWSRAYAEVSYVGSRGDNLIRPIDINYPQPDAVVALQATTPGAVNPVRPYRSYGEIRVRETTAKSRYHGLLTAFRYDAGVAGTLTVNYTLSRNRTDSTNDRDLIDVPQNPLDLEAEYADARTDRRHIFTASYVYEVPFFREERSLLGTLLGGWQVAGIVYANSGQPVPRVSVLTNNFRRGGFADLVGDINPDFRNVSGVPFWFDPAAFAPPPDGRFGNSGRAPFRQPGFHKWDITFSKNFYPTERLRLQFRADLINAFNQVNWASDPSATGLDNTCTLNLAACAVPGDTFGQLIAVRSPREIQLGLKLYW